MSTPFCTTRLWIVWFNKKRSLIVLPFWVHFLLCYISAHSILVMDFKNLGNLRFIVLLWIHSLDIYWESTDNTVLYAIYVHFFGKISRKQLFNLCSKHFYIFVYFGIRNWSLWPVTKSIIIFFWLLINLVNKHKIFFCTYATLPPPLFH